uniref:Cadherin-related family member 4 n=1 Tax=Mus spicilegus TaxID=10103 RepID=A0A8C6HYX4_MUSSI
MTRELHLLGPLDYEQQRLYKITILLIDHSQDWDLNSHRSGSCTITIEVEVSSTMTPLIVTELEAFWKPEPWFVVVLTATGAVLLLALGWLLSRILRGLAPSLQAPSKPAKAQLLNSIQGNEGSIERQMEAPRIEMSQVPRTAMSLQHFDGRAQDVCKSLLFITCSLPGPSPFPRISPSLYPSPSLLPPPPSIQHCCLH